jgi:hypothetical protein
VGQVAAGGIFPNLDSQTLLLDLELREVVLTHEIEDLLQLLDVDDQCAIGNCRMAGWQNCRKEGSKVECLEAFTFCNPAILQFCNLIAPVILL